MRTLIIYDSLYGNTERIAQAIAAGIGAEGDVRLANVGSVTPSDVAGVDMLIVGSPTQAWGATKGMTNFLKSLDAGSLPGVRAAAFDTKMKTPLSGSAARRLGKRLMRLGCKIIAPPAQFVVKGKEGPLLEGEYERAVAWGRGLVASAATANR